jgi:hypothetical protein
MITHGIQLRRSIASNDTGVYTACRMKVEVVSTCNVTPYIFVYETEVVEGALQLKKGTFKNVATPADLTEIPINIPSTSGLYRSNEIDLIFRASSVMDVVWATLLVDVNTLVTAITNKDTLLEEETIVI